MYRVCLVMCVGLAAAQNIYDNLESRSGSYSQGKPGGIGPLFTSGLSASQNYRDNSYEDNAVTPTPSPTPTLYRTASPQVYRKPTAAPIDAARDYQHQAPVRVPPQPQRQRNPPQFQNSPEQRPEAEEIEEEKEEEPDRLSILLQQSKFGCLNKQTGYYADEELNCEVFHYCQDNAKFSWICPEGFTFHQVHLICMPPSGDITCKKSSQYHFVNEYLYKPLNLAEAENKPNVTLRYSERYYPADIYADEREEAEYQVTSPTPAPVVRRPTQQVFLPQHGGPINALAQGRPQHQQQQIPSQFRVPVNQVFRSPEEVNIPLQQRRPQPLPQQQQQPLRRFPQVRPDEEDYE
ncbi:uncharacterized protein LOC124410350 [Diprion similis]|uniref:uncharacterized protein LOC124410350 n=1 Tax=Diprion similis TaxID=362088 RepID=UPI001EF928E6|nr:uncharacterized protein LOC124410350 [Diprion similis]